MNDAAEIVIRALRLGTRTSAELRSVLHQHGYRKPRAQFADFLGRLVDAGLVAQAPGPEVRYVVGPAAPAPNA